MERKTAKRPTKSRHPARKTATGKRPARKLAARRPAAATEDFITGLIDAPAGTPAGAAPDTRSLGTRLREARQMCGLTIEDLSSRSGVSVDRLERVEANETVPPLGQLVRLGKAVEMKLGYFLSGGEESPLCVVRADARRMVARRGRKASKQYGYVYESLAADKSDRLMEPFLVTLVPSEYGELSSHDGQEFLFVVEGKIRAQVGKTVEVLGVGDSIYYDSSSPHLVKCHGRKPARILAVIYAGER